MGRLGTRAEERSERLHTEVTEGRAQRAQRDVSLQAYCDGCESHL
jgi:hypothetical protein